MADALVLLEGRVVAHLVQDQHGSYQLTYAESWRDDPAAYPLSLSMPLATGVHADALVRPFLAGLLPDNDAVLRAWGRRFGVSPRNPLALLRNMGEDCAGAIQIVEPSDVERVLSDAGGVEWLPEDMITEELAGLRAGAPAGLDPPGTGRFSLAGAQFKTALLCDGHRWGRPRGPVPTSHILKPPHGEFGHFVENEHLTLRLANGLGLSAARSTVQHFGGEQAIVIERFDRVSRGGTLERVHQEDLCQALAVHPDIKYEAEGGPGVERVVALLRAQATRAAEAVQGVVDAVLFNLLIGGTDAHAKNFSLLLGPGGQVDLAPLYDLASIAPYSRQCPWHHVTTAMRFGGEYRVHRLGDRHLARFARQVGYGEDVMRAVVSDLRDALPGALSRVVAEALDHGLDGSVVRHWASSVQGHCDRVGV